MHDHILIYVIVLLNALCQVMLIWRLKLSISTKWRYCLLTVSIPVALMATMRILIASGGFHARLAEQSLLERVATQGASVLLLAGPWLVTMAAVIARRRSAA